MELKYKKLIEVGTERIIQYIEKKIGPVNELLSKDKKEILEIIQKKMARRIFFGMLKNFWQPTKRVDLEYTIKKKKGSCLSYSILLCSIFRTLGFTEKEVFIIITRNKNKKFHAMLLIRLCNNKYVILDPPFIMRSQYIDLKKENNKRSQKIFCCFNDKYSFLFLSFNKLLNVIENLNQSSK